MKDRLTPNHIESIEDNEVFNLQRFLDAQSHCYQQAYRKWKTDESVRIGYGIYSRNWPSSDTAIMQSIMVSAGTMRLRHI